MRAELANLDHCAVPFLRHAATNLLWYYTTRIFLQECVIPSIHSKYAETLQTLFATVSTDNPNLYSSHKNKCDSWRPAHKDLIKCLPLKNSIYYCELHRPRSRYSRVV